MDSEMLSLCCADSQHVNKEAISTATNAVEVGIVSYSSWATKAILCEY